MTPDLSRRAVLAAAAAAPLVARADPALFDADVAIIGAGAAGLAAARECQRLKRSFVMLEARHRIGGRVFTDTSLGEPFDAGAMYIHWSETNPWAKISRDLKVATVNDGDQPGGFQLYEHGVRQERNPRRGAAFDRLSALVDVDAAGVPDVSISARVAGEAAEVVRAAGAMCRMSLGEEPERVSAKDYARLSSGDDLLVPDGYGALVARYGADLPVRLGVTVTGVDWSGPGVRLTTSQGDLRARGVVVTAPMGVLASGAIRFTPALPVATQEAVAALPMGLLAKIALKFDGRRFGLPEGADLFDQEGPRELFDFECFAYRRNLIVATLGGDHARRVMALGRAGAMEECLSRLAAIAGPEIREGFVAGAVADWQNDPFSLGAYSHCLPGAAAARETLAQPVGGRVWFAGEAIGGADFGGAMTAGGAFLSGRDAARGLAGA